MAVVWPSKNNFANGDVLTATNMNNIGDTLNVFNPTSATNGQVWQANGSGSGSYQTLSVNSFTLITSGTLGAAANLTSIPGTYRDLILYYRDAEASATQQWEMRVNADTGNNYDFTWQASYNAQYLNGGGQTAAQWRLNGLSVASTNTNGALAMRFYDYADSGTGKVVSWWIGYKNTAATYDADEGIGYYRGAGAITQINIIPLTANWSSGTYALYGVK